MTTLATLRREVRAIVPPGAVLHWLRDAAVTVLFLTALAAVWIGCVTLF